MFTVIVSLPFQIPASTQQGFVDFLILYHPYSMHLNHLFSFFFPISPKFYLFRLKSSQISNLSHSWQCKSQTCPKFLTLCAFSLSSFFYHFFFLPVLPVSSFELFYFYFPLFPILICDSLFPLFFALKMLPCITLTLLNNNRALEGQSQLFPSNIYGIF